MNLPLQKSFFWWPTPIQSLVDCAGRHCKKFTCLRNRYLLTKYSYQPIGSLISFLFLSGGPSAVVLAIAFGIVNSVKAATIWAGSHVRKENIKNFPAWVVRNTSNSVISGVVPVCNSATSTKFNPRNPLWGISLSVLDDCSQPSFSAGCPTDTSTRFALSGLYVRSGNPATDSTAADIKTPASFFAFFRSLFPESFHNPCLRFNNLFRIIQS